MLRGLALALGLSLLSVSSAAQTPSPAPEGPAPAAGTVPAPPRPGAAPFPTEAFARLPFLESASLSPDGKHLAGLVAVRGVQKIITLNAGDTPSAGDPEAGGSAMSGVRLTEIEDLTEVRWIRWVGNDHIIVSLQALAPVGNDNWYVSRLMSINRTTGAVKRLMWHKNGQNGGDVLWVAADGSTDILMAAQDSIYSIDAGFWPSVYRVDVATGSNRTETIGRKGVTTWDADHRGRTRMGLRYRAEGTEAGLLYRGQDDSGFREISHANLLKDEDFDIPLLYLPGGDHALILKEDAAGKTGIVEIDVTTGQPVRTIYAHPELDVTGVALSRDGSQLIGAYLRSRTTPVHWIDPVMAARQATLNAKSPKSDVSVVSYNADYSRLLVRFSTPDSPGLMFVYDAATDALTNAAAMNADIGSKRLSRSKMVTYKARDGLEIEAVLTLPRGRAPRALPFVVMPHGGPWAHDELGYNYWVQFLAERGYGVIQPNFRGSTGYGETFEKAGQGQLGFAMQDDVSDAVRWAVGEGLADPARVCIVGASYGGYAAMWGIAKDPDQYRCAISIAGVANLRREVNDFGGNLHGRLYKSQWEQMTPDFAAVSPINAIERIKTPLLLIHGKKDVTVDHVQSVKMHAAMTKAGKMVEFVSIPLADHYFTREADRLVLLQAMEKFLQAHNPAEQGAAAP